MSDLRESGAIEQDADIVCFIHRPEYYKILEDENGNSLQGLAEIIIAKHRNGPTGFVRLKFESEYALFLNMNDGVVGNKNYIEVRSKAGTHQQNANPPMNDSGNDFLQEVKDPLPF